MKVGLTVVNLTTFEARCELRGRVRKPPGLAPGGLTFAA